MENLSKSIEEIVIFFDRVTTEYGDLPAAGSVMEKELADYDDKPRINEPYFFARLNLKAGREQLAAQPDLIRGNKFFTSPVAARAVLESAALASWLLDSGIDAKERVTRGIIQLCDGKNQIRKFHNENYERATALGAAAEAAAAAAAITQINDFFATKLPAILASNNITFPGNPPTPHKSKSAIVDMIRDQLGEEFRLAYRMLSGFAHGQGLMLATFGFDIKNAAGSGGMKTLNEKPDDRIQFYSMKLSVEAFKKALTAYFTIVGWDFTKIQPSFDNFFAELRLAIIAGND